MPIAEPVSRYFSVSMPRLPCRILESDVDATRDIVIRATMHGVREAERNEGVDEEQKTPSCEERAKAERRKILDRLNSVDTGSHHHDREQEESRVRGIDTAREKERRPEPGNTWGSGC